MNNHLPYIQGRSIPKISISPLARISTEPNININMAILPPGIPDVPIGDRVGTAMRVNIGASEIVHYLSHKDGGSGLLTGRAAYRDDNTDREYKRCNFAKGHNEFFSKSGASR